MRKVREFILLACLGLLVPGGLFADVTMLVGSYSPSEILKFDATTGTFAGVFASGGGLSDPSGLVFGPNGNLFVASAVTNQILEYNGTTGAFITDFASGNGLDSPSDLGFGSDGDLYVADNDGCLCIKRYSGTTGAFLGNLAFLGDNPQGLTIGPNGNLYVTLAHSTTVDILDPTTGTIVGSFSAAGQEGLTFGPGGDLYIANFFGNAVERYSPTGAFLGVFASGGGLDRPVGLDFGPDGNLYVDNYLISTISVFNGATGTPIDTISGGGLNAISRELAFIPQSTPVPEPGLLVPLGVIVAIVSLRRRNASR
jgi:WD40 repeat protein